MSNRDPYTDPDRVVIEDGRPVRKYHMRDGRWLSRREAEAERADVPRPQRFDTPPAITITDAGEITVQVVLGVKVDPMAWAHHFGTAPVEVPGDVERFVIGLVETELRSHVDDQIRVRRGVPR